MTTNPFIPTTSGLQPNAGQLGTPGAITATSSTVQTIQTGVMAFTIQSQCAFAPGMQVSIVDSAQNSNYMNGVVQSYTGTTLTVNVLTTNGSGSYGTWLINLAGSVGPVGATGATGAQGATGASGASLATLGEAIGLKVTNNGSTPTTKINITSALAMLTTSAGVATRVSAASVTIDLTTGTSTSAANGMDGEARGTSAWIYCYLINNGTTTAGLGSKTSPTSGAPTLPSGYTSYLYVGAMFVDSSGNLLRSVQLGRKSQYVVVSSTNTASLPLIANGSGGSVTTPTWIGLDTTSFVPASASRIRVLLQTNFDSGTAAEVIVAPNNSYGAVTSNNPPYGGVDVNAGAYTLPEVEMSLESTNIYWASSAAGGALYCAGWEDNSVPA